MIPYLLLLIIDQYCKYIYCTHKNYGIDMGIQIKNPYLYNIIFLIYGYYINIHPLVLIGGFSNLIDRISYGYVRDHLTLYPFDKVLNLNYVYNLADVYITLGCTIYMYVNVGPFL